MHLYMIGTVVCLFGHCSVTADCAMHIYGPVFSCTLTNTLVSSLPMDALGVWANPGLSSGVGMVRLWTVMAQSAWTALSLFELIFDLVLLRFFMVHCELEFSS